MKVVSRETFGKTIFEIYMSSLGNQKFDDWVEGILKEYGFRVGSEVEYANGKNNYWTVLYDDDEKGREVCRL